VAVIETTGVEALTAPAEIDYTRAVSRDPAPLPIVLIPHPHVRIDRSVLGGSPFVVGSRVPVRRLWGFYRAGASVEVLIKRYPRLGAGKILDALAFAFDNQDVIETDIQREEQMLRSIGERPVERQLSLFDEG
jgi:uncharacterized protein (DUF433 family)